MTDNPSQDAGSPSDEQELDPSTLSDEELRAYFTGGVSEETPESDESETDTQEETEAGNTADDLTEDTAEEQDRLSKMRVRPRDDVDQQILDLYKSEGFSGTLADAARVIQGEVPSQPSATQTQETESPKSDPTAEIRAKITELQEKAKAASEDLDTAQVFELQNELMEHRLNLLKLENDAERQREKEQQQVEETYRQKAVESREKVFSKFPVLKDANSTERKLFDNFIAEKQNDPDYEAVFSSPKWVELMANEFASTNEISNQPQEQVSLDNLNKPPKTNTKVLTSASNTSSVSKQPKITSQGVRDNMHRLDRDTLYSMLGQG